MTYQISSDQMLDMAGDLNKGASWAYLARQYGIPAQSLKRAYIRRSRQVYSDCEACGQPARYSTSYDEPHWVHVRIADTVACPMYASAR